MEKRHHLFQKYEVKRKINAAFEMNERTSAQDKTKPSINILSLLKATILSEMFSDFFDCTVEKWQLLPGYYNCTFTRETSKKAHLHVHLSALVLHVSNTTVARYRS